METAVVEKNTALSALTPEEQKTLQIDREKQGNSYPSLPLIRLSNKDMTQAPEGEYFTEVRGGDQPQITPIGANPKITILYKTATYSYYTPEDGLVAWTTDIHGFSPVDTVTLFVKKNGKVEIAFDGFYSDFKKYVEANYTTTDPVTGKAKKLLKFKTVLYVEYEGEVYKMLVSNASSAGVDMEGNPSFGDPQPDSLQMFMDSWWNEKRVSYEFSLELGSRYVESSKPYYIMTFSNVQELEAEDLKRTMAKSKESQKLIIMLDEARKTSNSSPVETVKAEDLPF